MVTRAGDAGPVRHNGGLDTTWSRGNGHAANPASSILATLTQAGSELASVLATRPSLLAGFVAVALGAFIGSWLADRFRRRSAAPGLPDVLRARAAGGVFMRAGRTLGDTGRSRSVERATDQVQAALRLVPLGLRLFSNPVVRYVIRRALARQVAQRFGR